MEHDEALDYFDYCGHTHEVNGDNDHEEEEEISRDIKYEEEISRDIKYEEEISQDIKYEIPSDTNDNGLAVVDTGNYDDEVPQSVQSYTQANQWQTPGQQQQPFVPRTLPIEKTLWMGDLNPEWSEDFIKESFAKFEMKIIYVKMVQQNEKNKTMSGKDGKPTTYCFVEFEDEDAARYAMLNINGRTIHNDPERGKFNLSYANAPGQVYTEYNLFVNDLSPSVDDATLFKLFGERYKSCRGAKIYRYQETGKSKGSGFIKFTSQTDQQRALVELNKYKLKGRALNLRLANPLQRGGPRIQTPQQGVGFSAGMVPYQAAQPYGTNQSGPLFNSSSDYYDRRGSGSRRRDRDDYRDRDYDRRDRERKRDRRRDSRSPEPVKQKMPILTYYEDSTPLTNDEHNELFMVESEELFASLESSRWSKLWIAPDMRHKDLINAICSD